MVRRFGVWFIALMFALSAAAPVFGAGRGKGRGKGNPPGWEKGEKKGWKGGSEPPSFGKRGGKSKKAKKNGDDDEKEKDEKGDKEKKKKKEKVKKEKKSKKEKKEKEIQREAAGKKVNNWEPQVSPYVPPSISCPKVLRFSLALSISRPAA